MLAAQSISLGHRRVMAAGGFESMSNTPYYLPKARTGLRLGHGSVLDGIIHDGLWDIYNDHHMGICAEKCSEKYGIGREAQDAHAAESYKRAASAWEEVRDLEGARVGHRHCRGDKQNHHFPMSDTLTCRIGPAHGVPTKKKLAALC